jgi:hypothetical protein
LFDGLNDLNVLNQTQFVLLVVKSPLLLIAALPRLGSNRLLLLQNLLQQRKIH